MPTGLVEGVDEQQLVVCAREGDMSAFDALVLRYSERVYRLALRMLGNREDAEDIQQESFVCAYRALNNFRGESSFGTWLYAITARLCLSRIRWRLRRPAMNPVESLVDVPASEGDPEERALAAESAARTQRTLAVLAPPDRLLIVLKYVEELSHVEIAEILGCSVESSRSRLVRAKKLFKKHYERMV